MCRVFWQQVTYTSATTHHVWTTVTASWSELLTAWCDGCMQSRTLLYVWSPTWHHFNSPPPASSSLAACHSTCRVDGSRLAANKSDFKLATLVFRTLHGSAPQYLVDGCQRVTASGRRHATAIVRRQYVRHSTHPHSSRRPLLRSAGPRLWNSFPVELRHLNLPVSDSSVVR